MPWGKTNQDEGCDRKLLSSVVASAVDLLFVVQTGTVKSSVNRVMKVAVVAKAFGKSLPSSQRAFQPHMASSVPEIFRRGANSLRI